MNKPGIVIVFFFLLSAASFGQNLVPNGDFEGKNGKITPRPWIFINTIDYYIYSSAAASSENPADKNQTLRHAHSGKAYIGMRIWPAYREYIQVKLSAPLKAGKNYSFKMYLAVSPYCNAVTKEIGAFFSKKSVNLSDYTIVNKTKPQLDFSLSHAYKDSVEWFLLSGTFTAKGGEKFLSIGHFTSRFRSRFSKKNPAQFIISKEAYYYIDDISVYESDQPVKEMAPIIIDTLSLAADTAKEPENYFQKQAETSANIVLKNICFAVGRADLLPESYDELGLLLDLLIDNPEMEIAITGHTDNTGEEKENKKLSLQRAEAVVRYLADNGISDKRLHYSGKGSDNPIATNNTGEGRQQNRRVEFVILKK